VLAAGDVTSGVDNVWMGERGKSTSGDINIVNGCLYEL
jgi:hypothetical protein